MDTAQRGMGLDWPTSLELIRRSLDAARDFGPGALVASGCGTDHLVLDEVKIVDDVIRGYEEQMEAIEKLGGKLIVMASRALARVAQEPGRLRTRVRPHPEPGEAARGAALAGRHVRPGAGGLLGLARCGCRHGHGPGRDRRAPGQGRRHQDLAARQGQGNRHAPAPARHRRADGQGVRMYTGDDFNYAELIAGDGSGSDAAPRPERCAAGHLRRHRARSQRGARRIGCGATRARSTPSWAPRCRCRATSSRRPRASTKPAWSSWPGSTGTRVTSPWWVVSRAHARWCTLRNCSAWPTQADLLEQPELAVQRMGHLLALHGVAA